MLSRSRITLIAATFVAGFGASLAHADTIKVGITLSAEQKAYADARIVKIAGGSIEVMKTIISREMFKGKLSGKR